MNSSTFNNQNMVIRKGNKNDLKVMLQLFTDTINTVCRKDYDDKQCEVWSSGVENAERWLNVITDQYVLVALSENQIVGFCTLDRGDYIDLLFVHKDYQQQGIASKLYKLIEKEALKQNTAILFAEVSKTARPFFEKSGFCVMKEQTVNVKGVDFINYKMQKKIFS